MHLIIDGYGGDTAKMWDLELVREFLTHYPATLGMTPIAGPNVLEYRGPILEDSGISGFVIIAESHISIHTFPYRQYVNIDIFSCKSFDNHRALADAKALFGLVEVKTWLLERGLEWLDEGQGLAQVQRERGELSGRRG